MDKHTEAIGALGRVAREKALAPLALPDPGASQTASAATVTEAAEGLETSLAALARCGTHACAQGCSPGDHRIRGRRARARYWPSALAILTSAGNSREEAIALLASRDPRAKTTARAAHCTVASEVPFAAPATFQGPGWPKRRLRSRTVKACLDWNAAASRQCKLDRPPARHAILLRCQKPACWRRHRRCHPRSGAILANVSSCGRETSAIATLAHPAPSLDTAHCKLRQGI